MKGQKEFVVEAVKQILGGAFIPLKDNALLMMTKDQVESVKEQVFHGIKNGAIAYSKDVNNTAEVLTYARSMTVNHLKKCKELNGNVGSSNNISDIKPTRGIDTSILSEELKEYLKNLV